MGIHILFGLGHQETRKKVQPATTLNTQANAPLFGGTVEDTFTCKPQFGKIDIGCDNTKYCKNHKK